MQLEKIGENIWIYNGTTVKFYGFPFTTRMTVIRLANDALWVHSPVKLNPELQREIHALGRVAFLISPNKLHHLFLQEWISAYPDAKTYAAPGLSKKRQDIRFAGELGLSAEREWANEIGQTLFQGSPVMEEAVFFHIESKTLVLTDLIENIRPDSLSDWRSILARIAGVVSPDGKTPLDWRLSFMFGKTRARRAVNAMMDWQPENVIVSHGECIFGNGTEFLKKSFSWV